MAYPKRSATAADGFPIPMRGNEKSPVIITNIEVDEFPIPMRGNETPIVAGGTNHPHSFRSP